ncbi:hypothetical protein PHYPSEUDO_014502 [Phytophthora pseudosyringae]|uniref:RxLR effector protein n=1 Tax=Phytophthora pseudosyringae TaxID=221518 RepID=A0A8T1V492_9STRA|nr:hypothetical protein PHYPSEUDO_014502 [Phytophthora pseudosyringae]
MRVSQVLLATTVVLLATSTKTTTASDTTTKSKTPVPAIDDSDLFMQKIPFKYGNMTGTMSIKIDPNSLHELSEDELASTDASKVYDFTQSDETGSDGEERGLFGRSFVDKLLAMFKFDRLAYLLSKAH